ncbi:hypothetical protein KEM55_005822 [Ascosphaera atra]|nr:hypothetical protein KEM55_005822 [Ascosphaera atra]
MQLQDTTAGASPGVSVSVGTGASPLTGTTTPSIETSTINSTARSDGARTGNVRKDDGGDGDSGGGKDGGSGGASSKQPGHAQHGDGRTGIFDKQSFSYLVRSGIAGGMAGCAAKTVVGPLDRVKILFQTANPQFRHYSTGGFGVFQSIRDIYRSDGVPGLFRGHSATLLRIFPYAAIRFLAYEQYRSVLIPTRDHETSLRRLFSGSLAGMTSVFATYPLEVVRVRLAFETRRGVKSSLRATAREIYNEHPPVRAATSASSAASTAATAATGQQQVVTTRVGGLSNFYRGFTPTIVGIFPYAGMAFLTHDVIHDFFYSDLVSRYTTIANTYVPDPYSRSTVWICDELMVQTTGTASP